MKAERKAAYMKWGWIDLLASVPTIDPLRSLRLIRIFKILRVIRSFKAIRILVKRIFTDSNLNVFYAVVSFSIILLFFGSIAILVFEVPHVDSNIQTAEEAIWWSFVTITTVGYGDFYPISWEGRIVAAALMTVCIGLFGTFTALVAAYFIDAEEESELEKIKSEMIKLSQKLMSSQSRKAILAIALR